LASSLRSRGLLVPGNAPRTRPKRERFERIGRATYVSATRVSADINGMAVVLGFVPMAVGVLQGVRTVESQDLSAACRRARGQR
jgi:hypothetical protein